MTISVPFPSASPSTGLTSLSDDTITTTTTTTTPTITTVSPSPVAFVKKNNAFQRFGVFNYSQDNKTTVRTTNPPAVIIIPLPPHLTPCSCNSTPFPRYYYPHPPILPPSLPIVIPFHNLWFPFCLFPLFIMISQLSSIHKQTHVIPHYKKHSFTRRITSYFIIWKIDCCH